MSDAPALATTDDLEDVPGLDLTAVSTAAQKRALQLATSRIVAALDWDPFESERTYRLRPAWCGRKVFLPALNVTALALTLDDLVITPLDDYWTAPESVVYLSQVVSRSGLITYTAGWAEGEFPQPLVDACVELAVQLIENPERTTSWRVEDVAEAYTASTDGSGSTDDRRLDAYRIMAIA